jgi:hypothetical protein
VNKNICLFNFLSFDFSDSLTFRSQFSALCKDCLEEFSNRVDSFLEVEFIDNVAEGQDVTNILDLFTLDLLLTDTESLAISKYSLFGLVSLNIL